ncbi:DUF1005 family protein [Quillaja saponaria]|uniref:DUF1005 family protein n=1 Tax=Quillaja saponaria TaxID=32244 RepID=A0AAD7PUW4_QUISA|nr:DUF1005 family protein [Quillaja saponaria]
MDPCPFLRILVGNLAIKFPAASMSSFSGTVHPSSSSQYFCKVKLKEFPQQFSTVPLIPQNSDTQSQSSLAACFDLSITQLEKLKITKNSSVKISVYKRPRAPGCGGVNTAKLIGKILVPLDLGTAESRVRVLRNGWVTIGAGSSSSSSSSSPQLYLTVRTEPDPRFVFRFDGEPECSPQVFQIQGSVTQPVFTCKFGCRNQNDRDLGSRSSESNSSRSWLPSFKSNKDQAAKERKGWSITIHDLSGSPLAIASMVTPFVPTSGSNRVSRSNPGAWLILRAGGDSTWKPWGRLEAWRENSNTDAVGYRFEVLTATTESVTLSSSTVSAQNGGKFTIDVTSGVTPVNSPRGSCDFGSGTGSGSWSWSWSGSGSGSEFGIGLVPQFLYKGFVMSASVEGEGKCSKPEVKVGVQHVSCAEDAAAFVALAAAMDLSIDACRSFSQKLRKELRS